MCNNIKPYGTQGVSINSGRKKNAPELKNHLSILQQQARCLNCNSVS
jgi:hypothetical protein